MVREVFNQIRTQYRRTSQHIDALKRQMENDPDKFKDYILQQEKEKEEAILAQIEEKKQLQTDGSKIHSKEEIKN